MANFIFRAQGYHKSQRSTVKPLLVHHKTSFQILWPWFEPHILFGRLKTEPLGRLRQNFCFIFCDGMLTRPESMSIYWRQKWNKWFIRRIQRHLYKKWGKLFAYLSEILLPCHMLSRNVEEHEQGRSHDPCFVYLLISLLLLIVLVLCNRTLYL